MIAVENCKIHERKHFRWSPKHLMGTIMQHCKLCIVLRTLHISVHFGCKDLAILTAI